MIFEKVLNKSGFSGPRLGRVTPVLEGYIERGEVAGVVTRVYRRGELVQADCLGWQDRENKIPMRPDSIFRIMSMTKPVVAVAALTLVEEGRLRLDDPVDPWLPELAGRKVLLDPDGPLDGEAYPAPRPITLRDLLTNRSGIGFMQGQVPYCKVNHDLIPGPLSYARIVTGSPNQAFDLSVDQWMAEIGKLPLRFAPGERWLYNVSSDILGVLVARVAGQDLGDFFRQRLFEPLGMVDSGFVVPVEKRDRFCVGYGSLAGSGATVIVDRPETTIHAKPPLFPSGAAGLVSTADDYLRFAIMLLEGGKLANQRILGRKTVELMTANHLSEEQVYHAFIESGLWGSEGFGLGVATVARQSQVGPSAGSFYWGGAYGTHWLADPRENLVIVLMIQMMNTPLKISGDFNTLVYQALED